MRKILLAFVCIAKAAGCCAQQTARETTMAINGGGPFTALYRPGTLSEERQLAAGVQLEQRFMLKALNVCSMAGVIPVAAGTFGCLAGSMGSSVYREQWYALGYGHRLGDKLRVGVLFDYWRAAAAGYDQSSVVGGSGGIVYQLTDKCHARIHVLNVAGPSAMYTTGLGYESSPQCRLALEVRKEEQRSADALFTCEYKPLPRFACLLGVATAPQLSYAGVACVLGKVKAVLSGSYHPQLGITPNFLLVWQQK